MNPLTALPDKMFFKIGEVSQITGIKPYVLRYWETEFKLIRPQKSKIGQRLYRRKDIELILRLKKLLYEERYTISGAKKRIAQEMKNRNSKEDISKPSITPVQALEHQVRELKSLLNMLQK